MSTTPATATTPGTMSAATALEFFDPELASHNRSNDLVRLLLDDSFECPPVRVPARAEDVICSRLAYHRLVPQLRSAIESGRIIGATDQLRATVQRASTQQAMHGLQLEAMLVEIGKLFDDHGIEYRVLKGTATGHLDHAQAGLRQSADVDLLIRGDDAFDHAGLILAERGFSSPDLAVRLMDKGETWRFEDVWTIDLHRRLHTAGRSLPDDWWTRWETFVVAGREFRALDRSGRMAHAAGHYALSYPNHRVLSSLLDLVTIARSATEHERRDSSALLDQMGVGDIVRRITERAVSLCGDDRIVIGSTSSRLLDRALRCAYDRPDLDKFALKMAKTLGMPPREQRRVLRNWIAPSDAFLEKGGYSSRRDRIRTVARRVRSR